MRLWFKRDQGTEYHMMEQRKPLYPNEHETDDTARILVDGSHGHDDEEEHCYEDHAFYNGSNNNDDGSRTHCHLMRGWPGGLCQDRRAERVLWAVACLSAFFICLELVGGYLAHSLAIMSDAGHMVSDLVSFLISICAIRWARAAPTRRLSFGYARAEVLGACMSLIILWIITVVLVIFAAQRIIEGKYEIEGNTMLYTSGAGVIFNIIMATILQCGGHGHTHHGMAPSHSHSHSHAHGHSHDAETSSVTSHAQNVNVRAAFIHVVGDLIQSFGVLISAVVVKYTDYQIADPLCTFFFSIIVLFTSIPVLRDIGTLLMEGVPKHVDVTDITKDLLGMQGVKGVHDLHVWALNMEKVAMSAHLAVESAERAVYTAADARRMLANKYPLHSITLQTEVADKTMDTCQSCREVV
ncbi:unnamed protein product, partial [Mesorhabditis spiculigera]